ncbi:ATP-binding protein [Crossiella cryophila]|uniref:AAA+ ATPase domain-containing protein n=1 Tax=Crossiella cryophila TaxID=43355 RepID=A0A7W7CL29_9PSEU|nr:DUF87 domain-containing protein [Crossiella cryophila]MBB4681781.1 hypothetical protein [Crossiella cryophila]
MVSGLLGQDVDQLGTMLAALGKRAGCTDELTVRLRGIMPLTRQCVDDFVGRLRALDPQVAGECQDTLRALVLYRAKGQDSDIGHAFLALEAGVDEADRKKWGFRSPNRSPQLILSDLSRLFALTGPVVMAVDQIDTVITQSTEERSRDLLADRLADGLMRIREETRRTILVVACIGSSWELIKERAVSSAADRFRVLELRTAMPSSAVAEAIVASHLGSLYGEIGFSPPYPTWPVLPSAFEDSEVIHYTPRRLLQRVDEHVVSCLADGEVRELTSFGVTGHEITPQPTAAPADLMALDELFDRLRTEANVLLPLDHRKEDERMPALLGAALRCYVLERGGAAHDLTIDPPPGLKPALHARLRRTLDEAREDEVHWGFRAIAHTQPTAVLTRLKSACLEAGLHAGAEKRHLVVLRNTAFSTGPATAAARAAFTAAGGLAVPLSEDDLRTFSALENMLTTAPPGFQHWLAARLPASRSHLLSHVLPATPPATAPLVPAQPPASLSGPVPPTSFPAPGPRIATIPDPTGAEPAISLGTDVLHGGLFAVPLSTLRKHTALFAGSGSGKTVLLRRIVEEAALHGVSSILIDTNNDLARLGDAWPTPPPGWGEGDADRAKNYLANTDVVIWTPRREAGRPLTLNPLPDFTGVLDDADEFRTAIDAAVAGLLPRTGLTRRRLATGTAVLTEALTHFARRGGDDLQGFVKLLDDLPEGVSTIRNAPKLAADIADGLHAEMINDPVFGGAGERLDPGVLLTPAPGKRVRVSVISCIGLPNDDQRQTFVNQLQLALFSWVRRNPATNTPLGGLLVLDEAQTFAPARTATASTESTLKLASQARKYGLGLIYATQAPKALHNLVTGNVTTQFFGHLNAPTQIQAAKDLASAKNGRVDDISRLAAGSFYGASEGTTFTKLKVPMCLTHHPPSALTEEEVLTRARRDGAE